MPEKRVHALAPDSDGSIKELWNTFKFSNSWVGREVEVDCSK